MWPPSTLIMATMKPQKAVQTLNLYYLLDAPSPFAHVLLLNTKMLTVIPWPRRSKVIKRSLWTGLNLPLRVKSPRANGCQVKSESETMEVPQSVA